MEYGEDPHAEVVRLRAELAALRALAEDNAGWYRLILESASDYAVITANLDGQITLWNIGAQNVLGWDAADILGQPLESIFTPGDRTAGVPEREMSRARTEGRAEDERWHLRQDGSTFWASGLMMPLLRGETLIGYLKILRDQTERRQTEQALQQALAEKDILIADVHHRVKNSLQMVQSLLALQSRLSADPEATAHLAESAARIRSIAAVHDQLSRSGAALEVAIDAYLETLIGDLQSAIAPAEEAGRTITLEADRAVWPAVDVPPLGLVVTELVTNALKYGQGVVRVSFRQPPGGRASVIVEDEGPGLPADFDPERAGGLGLRLVNGMLRGPDAGLHLDRDCGHTRFVVHLPAAHADTADG
jgi:PAS domain S-box-containing protein